MNECYFSPTCHIVQTVFLVIFSYSFETKKNRRKNFFDKVENLARAVQAVAETIPKADYEKSLQGQQNRLQRCMNVNGEYFEGMNQLY